MGTKSDYVAGTITVTQGSVNFTGTGTLWRIMGFQEGDTVLLKGYQMVIDAGNVGSGLETQLITSNTSGKFTEAWPGASGTFPYRMRYQSNDSRLSAKVSDFLLKMASGTLSSIGELEVTEVADKLIKIMGPGQAELIDLSQAGLQDPNGSLGKLAKLPDVGTLGLTLLPLVKGTSTQYVQGDGTLQAKAGLPVSTATQTALDGKLNTSGGQMLGSISFRVDVPTIQMRAPGGGVGYDVFANVSNSVNAGLNIRDVASNSVFLTIGGSTIGAYQVRVTGAMQVTGALAKGAGTFLIDHPLDPFNRNLRHGFVEAPRYDLIYRGTVHLVNGRATVDIDTASNMTSGTFAALTTNAVVTSLQNQDGFARLKPGMINGGSFEIICEDETCTDLVSWVVIAERNDPFVKSELDPNTDSDGRFVPEFEKEYA